MEVFKRFLLRVAGKAKPQVPEQALIIHFEYGLSELEPMYEQSRRLEEILMATGVGEYDGHEIAVSLKDGFHYIYGPDADRLLEAVEPVLRTTEWFKRASITLRYGPAEDGVKRVVTEFAL